MYYGRGGEQTIRSVEAAIDELGNARPLEPVIPPSVRLALVTILEDAPIASANETALLSKPALA
jgi:hypothetical protein